MVCCSRADCQKILNSHLSAQYAAVVASLALSCTTAVRANNNYDDLVAAAHKLAKPSKFNDLPSKKQF